MTCDCCNTARQNPDYYRLCADYCLHCAARHIQRIQRKLQLPADKKRTLCRDVLEHAMAQGFVESEVRALAKAGAWALAPESVEQKRK